MKLLRLLSLAVFVTALGLVTTVSAQKKVGYLGPPVTENGKPKAKPKAEDDKKKVPPQHRDSEPQSGGASGFGVGTPGGTASQGQAGSVAPGGTVIMPPAITPDTDDPRKKSPRFPIKDEVKAETEPELSGNGAEIDKPIGKPATKKAAARAENDTASAPVRKNRKKVTPRAPRLRRAG